MTSAPVLLTGATGYVGSRLLRVLEERGQRVRCLTRRPEAVALHRDTTIVAGDVRELEGASAGRVFAIEPRGHREAIARALANEDRELAETRWSDAVSSAGPRPERYGGVRHGKRLVDTRSIRVRVSPEQAFRPIRRIGGETGWYFGDRVWRLRGFVDLLAGGVGARRGRRDPETPTVGSTLDFLRVEAYEPGRLLRLRAEVRLPGRAWLQFEVDRDGSGSTIRQTAIFHPTGLLGTAYWYGLFPVHSWIFKGILAKLADAAQAPEASRQPLPGVTTGLDRV